jgi:plasmid maintenance system antidote protein VapI
VKGQRGITADTKLCLRQTFETMPEFWVNLQSVYQLDKAKRESFAQIRLEVTRRPAAERCA